MTRLLAVVPPPPPPPDPVVTVTLSNVDVFKTVVSWLVTARPTSAVAPIDSVVLPMLVHVLPFAEIDAVTVLPLRASFSQTGVPCDPPAMPMVDVPADDRSRNSILP